MGNAASGCTFKTMIALNRTVMLAIANTANNATALRESSTMSCAEMTLSLTPACSCEIVAIEQNALRCSDVSAILRIRFGHCLALGFEECG